MSINIFELLNVPIDFHKRNGFSKKCTKICHIFLLSYEQMIIKCEEQKFEKSGKSIFDLYCALRSDCDMKNMRPRKKNNLHFKITEIYRAFQ